MKYVNLDPFPANSTTIELYRDGVRLADVYAGCGLVFLKLEEGRMTLGLKVVHEAAGQEVGKEFTLVLDGLEIITLEIETETGDEELADISELSELNVLSNEDDKIMVVVANSIIMTARCSTISLVGL